MSELANKILKLMKDEGLQEQEICSIVPRLSEEIENLLMEKITISPSLLYNLVDTVWYNLEHIAGGGNVKGMDNLRLLGSKYPTFMYIAGNDVYVESGKIDKLLSELEEILSKWSNDWKFVHLFTKSQEGWNGGKDNPSPVVIYEPNAGESASKFGYKHASNNSGLVDSNGQYIESSFHETVLCAIESKLGFYGKEPMMKSLLERLILTCKKAKQQDKGISFNFEMYDYTN